MHAAPPAELRVLLACMAEKSGGEDDGSLAELLSGDLNWDYLVGMAFWHGALPVVAWRVAGSSLVPADIRDTLREHSLAIAGWNLRLATELATISALLDSRGLQHIPYKGIVLSEFLYGTISRRAVCDLDLIVRRYDVPAAVACLEELGFRDAYGLNPRQRAAAIRYGYEYSFVREGVIVDLHWRFAQRYAWPSLDMEHIWRSLMPFTFHGREYKICSPEAMLASLCFHCAKHDWLQLSLFADLAALLRLYPALDWKTVESFAGDSHSRRSVLVSLRLTHEHLAAPLQPAMHEAIVGDPQVAMVGEVVSSTKWPSPRNPTPEQTGPKLDAVPHPRRALHRQMEIHGRSGAGTDDGRFLEQRVALRSGSLVFCNPAT